MICDGVAAILHLHEAHEGFVADVVVFVELIMKVEIPLLVPLRDILDRVLQIGYKSEPIFQLDDKGLFLDDVPRSGQVQLTGFCCRWVLFAVFRTISRHNPGLINYFYLERGKLWEGQIEGGSAFDAVGDGVVAHLLLLK